MTFLMIVQIILSIFLIGIILIQPGKSDMGISFGSSSQSIFGSRTAANFLTRTTSIVAFLFLLTSFLITKINVGGQSKSVIDKKWEETTPKAATEPAKKEEPKPSN